MGTRLSFPLHLGDDEFCVSVFSNQSNQRSILRSIASVDPLNKCATKCKGMQLEITKTRFKICVYLATKVSGVHVEKSAFAIHLRFIGVSKVIGKIDTANDSFGKPEFGSARDLVS